ncbi:hypothetical protein C7401_107293 [Paraburkholderia unamae]|nr:hypothetical protein C7401_107293 [Paraburkholderia unamae]
MSGRTYDIRPSAQTAPDVLRVKDPIEIEIQHDTTAMLRQPTSIPVRNARQCTRSSLHRCPGSAGSRRGLLLRSPNAFSTCAAGRERMRHRKLAPVRCGELRNRQQLFVTVDAIFRRPNPDLAQRIQIPVLNRASSARTHDRGSTQHVIATEKLAQRGCSRREIHPDHGRQATRAFLRYTQDQHFPGRPLLCNSPYARALACYRRLERQTVFLPNQKHKINHL